MRGRRPSDLNALKELLIIGAFYLCYSLTRGCVAGGEETAFGNALKLIIIERKLRLFIEPQIQNFVLNYPFLVGLANAIYMACYYPFIGFVGAWLYIFHRPSFYFFRNAFFLIGGLALLSFASFPVAPPRLLEDLGFVDTLKLYGPFHYGDPESSIFYNPFAAMPSLHFGWTLLAGLALLSLGRHPLEKALGVLVPSAQLFAITATANHFLLDAAGGLVAVGAGLLLLSLMERGSRREELWLWRFQSA